jgi:hypothetical protein
MNEQHDQYQQDHSELAAIQKAAVEKGFQPPSLTLGAAVVAFLLFSQVAMPLAVAAFSLLLYSGLKRTFRNGGNNVYIKDTQNYAHVLDESRLRRLLMLLGKDEVERQILHARDRGQKLSGCAEELLEHLGHSTEAPELKDFIQTVEATVTPLPEPPAPIAPLIGVETRLNAVPVSAVAMPDTALPSLAITEDDIVDRLINQGNSLVFMGGQGVGKSRLMAIASQRGLSEGRYKHVSVCSGLAKPNEDPIYWSHCSQKLFFDLAPMSELDRIRHLQAQLQAIQRFKTAANDQNPGLLILDEIAYLASILNKPKDGTVEDQLQREICDVVRVVCSGGAKRGWFVWVGTPQGAIGSMGIIGTEIKKLKLAFCGIAPLSIVQSRGHATTWDAGLYEAAARNWTLSSPPSDMSDRVVYFDGQWQQQTRYDLAPMPAAAPVQSQPTQPTQKPDQKLINLALQTINLAVTQHGIIKSDQLQAIYNTLPSKLIQDLFMAIAQTHSDKVIYVQLNGGGCALTQKKPVAANPSLALN